MTSWRSKTRLTAFLVFCGLVLVLYNVYLPATTVNIVFSDILSHLGLHHFTSVETNPQDDKNCSIRIQLDPCNCTRTLQVAPCPPQVTSTAEVPGDALEMKGQSTCGRWSTLRGPGQKVVSYSLFGHFPSEYFAGMELQLPRVSQVYPGWVVRVYLDLTQTRQQQWACSLACTYQHFDFCNIRQLPGVGDVSGSSGTSWRFCVVGDPLVERYIVRDADSPILQREVDAVNQWLKSGKCFHVMRDNPFHGVSMMAGMWGGCNTWRPSKGPETRAKMLRKVRRTYHDQPALWIHLWPWARASVIAHDSYTCSKFPGSLPFPTRRENFTFVGMRMYRKKFVNDSIRKPCPAACRPSEHQDWEKC